MVLMKTMIPIIVAVLAAGTEPEKIPEEIEAPEKEDKDYWEDVAFGLEDFAEVRRFIKLFYIDPSYDKRMSWVMASNFALHEMEETHEILPTDFHKKKRLSKKGRKRYGGPINRLSRADLFVIHQVGDRDREEEDPGVLGPRDIEDRMKEARRKREELEAAFSRIPFTENDFKRVIDFIRKREGVKDSEILSNHYFIAAARGYLASLDPHSTIISAKAWEESTRATTDSSFEGIGAVLTKKGEDTIIETPMEGQPAFKTGLRAGDVIMAVDGKRISGMSLHKVVERIRGPKGTAVTLTIRRMGLSRDRDFVITRDHIEIKNVQKRIVKHHPDIGYVKVTGFVSTTRESILEAIEALVEEAKGGRLRGVVLDLRHNSGGLLQESVDVADDFLDEGIIVSVRNPSDRDEVYKANQGAFDFPVVVIINSASASAAEILASAIQENGRGLVVGDRSFGKASVQTLLNPLLRRDYYIKLTVARYYAPSGRTIQVSGVVPDITIPYEPNEEPRPAFREEDLMHHLSEQTALSTSPNVQLADKVLACSRKMGIADRFYNADPNPQVKSDYQLMKAADYLECMIALNEGKTDTAVAGKAGTTAE